MTLSGRLVRVVLAAVVLALPAWSLAQNDEDDCVELGECLGLTFDLVFYVLLLAWPLMWLALRALLHVPRAFPTSVVSVGLAWVTWFTAQSVQHGIDPAGYDEPTGTMSLLAALPAVAVGAAAATLLVGPGSPGRGATALRVALPLLLLTLWPVAAGWEESRDEQQRIDDVAGLGVTTYQPRIAGVVTEGYRTGEGVRLHYTIRDTADYQFVSVTLLPAQPGRDLCSLVQSSHLADSCTSDGTTMRASREGSVELAVVRGDTVLHADTFEPDLVGPEEILAALREAPEVTPRTLVTSGE